MMVEPASWGRVAARIAAEARRTRVNANGPTDADVDGEPLAAGEQIRPDLVIFGAAPNNRNLALDVSFTMTGLERHNVPVYQLQSKRPARSPAVTAVENGKSRKYTDTALEKGEVFKGVVIGHGGQLSAGACYALEIGAKAIADRQGSSVGRVRAWWSNAICVRQATEIAQVVLDAATAMTDAAEVGTRHRVRDAFAEDVRRARDTEVAPSHCLSDVGFRRANRNKIGRLG